MLPGVYEATKKDGNMWEPTGGLVQSGENMINKGDAFKWLEWFYEEYCK